MPLFIIIHIILAPILFQQVNVEILKKEMDTGIEFYAKNQNVYPVTINVYVRMDNLKSTRSLPYTDVIPAQRTELLFALEYINSNKSAEYNTTYNYQMGSIFAQHDDEYAYRLPFAKGKEFRLSQGYGGSFSHDGDMRYSLDFHMPEGTEIYAARDGVVVKTESSHDQGGPNRSFMDYANYVVVLHSDGTFADYSHLKKGGVVVKEGQNVKRGQVVGYSGSTGFASGPHLHFAVKKAKRNGGFISLPVKFTTREGIKSLTAGRSYIGY